MPMLRSETKDRFKTCYNGTKNEGTGSEAFMSKDMMTMGFCAAPNAKRGEVFDGIMHSLSEHNNVMSYTPEMEELQSMVSFEKSYKDVLRYMLKDVETRAFARENGVDILLYRLTPYDMIAYTAAQNTVGAEYMATMKSVLFEHMSKFPFNMIIYCDFLPYKMEDPEFNKKTMFQLRVDNNLIKLIEKTSFEHIGRNTVEMRVQKGLEIIHRKLSKT